MNEKKKVGVSGIFFRRSFEPPGQIGKKPGKNLKPKRGKKEKQKTSAAEYGKRRGDSKMVNKN